MIMAAVGLPMILAYILVASDMRVDLSEMKPVRAMADDATALVGWPDLEIGAPSPRRVRMLGYMMDGYEPSRDGVPVAMFILMPEAGQWLHPAHRIPEEMVEVWLTQPTPFKFRRLVWASGLMTRAPGLRRSSGKAAYAVREAEVKPAAESDITRWFLP